MNTDLFESAKIQGRKKKFVNAFRQSEFKPKLNGGRSAACFFSKMGACASGGWRRNVSYGDK
jgi:hypothetical protein